MPASAPTACAASSEDSCMLTAQMTQLILFNIFNGLIVGAFYALMALGLSLILNLPA